MLTESGLKVFTGGNIGNPLINYVDRSEKADIVVVEVSSFQLDTINTFSPRVGVLLNISEDHLDRYDDFNDYAASKCRIFENHRKNDTAVFNGSDPRIVSMCRHIQGRKLPFFHQSKIPPGKPTTVAVINDTGILFSGIENTNSSIPFSDIPIRGRHNMENISAACLATLAVGGSFSGVQAALKKFRGLPHRMEYVTAIDDVQYFDDSKATNIDAVARALECFSEPVILIMGGLNKGNDFRLLKTAIQNHVKKIVLLGNAADEINAIYEGILPIVQVTGMADAVRAAQKAASRGDIVLLSPACASFDMFRSYAHRGDVFCDAVRNLKEVKI